MEEDDRFLESWEAAALAHLPRAVAPFIAELALSTDFNLQRWQKENAVANAVRECPHAALAFATWLATDSPFSEELIKEQGAWSLAWQVAEEAAPRIAAAYEAAVEEERKEESMA